MAKRDKIKPAERPDAAELLENATRPGIQWKIFVQVAIGVAVLWLVGFMVEPYVGYWGVGAVGVLTLGLIGFGIYVIRMTKKSAVIFDIMQGATDPEGRAAAIAKLRARGGGKGKDAMAALAHAQLVAQDDPKAALEILDAIDVAKAPTVVQDEVRSHRALFYLQFGRVKEARALADEIRLDRQPNAKSKALYAAVVAEAFSRTGAAEEAKKLLETYDPNDPDYAEVRPVLLRAQVFTYHALKKRGLVKKSMEQLMRQDPNALAAFVQKGTHPDLAKVARQLLQQAGVVPRQKVRMGR